jgi:myo-inositol catabolism protein IolC
MGKAKKTISVPVGLEQLLLTAAVDAGFRAELIRDRERAVARRGVELTSSELAVLAIAPDDQLAAMIDRIDTSEQNVRRRKFMRAVAATAVTLAAGTGLGACGSPGDKPAPETDAPFQGQAQKLEIEVPPVEPAGSRPLETIPGVKPDAGPPKIEIDEPELMRDGGARPDIDWENR